MTAFLPLTLGSLIQDASVRVERAAAELRAGRPVVVVSEGERLAIVSLDTVTGKLLDAFVEAADRTARLYLTPARAGVIGLDAPTGASLPFEGLDHEAARRIGYLREGSYAGGFEPGTAAAELGAQIAKLALLLPAIVTADAGEDGKGPFSGCVEVSRDDIEDAFDVAASDFALLTRTTVPLRDIGDCEFVMFRGGLAQRDQLAIVVGHPDYSDTVPVRVHSSCITGDLFGSLKCDCGDQLRYGLEQLKALGGGIMLYLDQEGRGTGLASKMRAYGYQAEGLDTVDADAELGFGADERRYEAAVAMLRKLGIAKVRLLTNNPSKIAWLKAAGIEVVERLPLLGRTTTQNLHYLETKTRRSGHMLDVEALRAS
ncbi:MAG: GTP cyclohydrolase II RibA [Rhizobiaceae bacterium]|nr:GTP cyclohydrolase II RibA [Rhizobiaceae bacterium]